MNRYILESIQALKDNRKSSAGRIKTMENQPFDWEMSYNTFGSGGGRHSNTTPGLERLRLAELDDAIKILEETLCLDTEEKPK